MHPAYIPSPRHHRLAHVPASTRPRCPVCKASVYSPGGIHPQCSAAREEGRLRDEARAASLAAVGG